MKLEKLLAQNKAPIVGRWLDLIFETYPDDAQSFLRKQKDHFANPVGTTLSKEIENLYDEVIEGLEPDRVSPILDRIIRIRAIQDFSPSQAVNFIFLLKKAIKIETSAERLKDQPLEDLTIIESRIDNLALLAFDIYMQCREKLYEIRANETNNRLSRLLQRAGLISEIQDNQPDIKNRGKNQRPSQAVERQHRRNANETREQ